VKKKSALLIAFFFMLFSAFPAQAAEKTPEEMVKEAKAAIKEASVDEVKKIVDEKKSTIVLLDVRDSYELEQGMIPGAINISRGQLEFKVRMILPDRNAKIIVYCGLDLRSPLATKTLNDLGYRNAVNMTGGLKAWSEAGYPLAK
jgi:rhodanese-related sulfurtransferase